MRAAGRWAERGSVRSQKSSVLALCHSQNGGVRQFEGQVLGKIWVGTFNENHVLHVALSLVSLPLRTFRPQLKRSWLYIDPIWLREWLCLFSHRTCNRIDKLPTGCFHPPGSVPTRLTSAVPFWPQPGLVLQVWVVGLGVRFASFWCLFGGFECLSAIWAIPEHINSILILDC